MNELEIEKKFIVDVNPKELNFKNFKIIEQKYLYIFDSIEKRIRKTILTNNILYQLITKIGKGNVRKEYTEGISKHTFYTIWFADNNIPIIKTRYIIPYKDKEIEVDIFDNYPISYAEIEFNSVKEMNNFEYPNWLSKETGIKNQDIFKQINKNNFNFNLVFY